MHLRTVKKLTKLLAKRKNLIEVCKKFIPKYLLTSCSLYLAA